MQTRTLSLLLIAAWVLLAPSAAGAKSKPAALKRPSYAVVQMQLQPIAYRLAANARRIDAIRADLQVLIQRREAGAGPALDGESTRHTQQVGQALAEISLRTEQQVELMELAPLIEIESKHDFFMRRLDRLYLVREIGRAILAEIGAHVAKIQDNAALSLIERAQTYITGNLEQFDSAIKTLTALEPSMRAGD